MTRDEGIEKMKAFTRRQSLPQLASALVMLDAKQRSTTRNASPGPSSWTSSARSPPPQTPRSTPGLKRRRQPRYGGRGDPAAPRALPPPASKRSARPGIEPRAGRVTSTASERTRTSHDHDSPVGPFRRSHPDRRFSSEQDRPGARRADTPHRTSQACQAPQAQPAPHRRGAGRERDTVSAAGLTVVILAVRFAAVCKVWTRTGRQTGTSTSRTLVRRSRRGPAARRQSELAPQDKETAPGRSHPSRRRPEPETATRFHANGVR